MTDDKTLDALRELRMTDDRLIARYVTALLEEAAAVRPWILLLDHELRWLPVAIPIDDMPADPYTVAAIPRGGPVPIAELFARRVVQIVDDTDAGAAVIVWERPGAPGVDEDTLGWVRAMRGAFDDDPTRLRAQLLLSGAGAQIVGEPARLRA